MSDARAFLASGDIAGLIRHLRFNADGMELGEVARLMAGAAAMSGFDDMQEAATAVAVQQEPQQLYDFGYACIERGIAFLAIPALTRALEMLPDEPLLLLELVSALERENRHADAVAVLEPRVDALEPWPARYLLAHNALFAGDLARAEHEAGRLPVPDDQVWLPARDRLARMITRGQVVRGVSPLDATDLRGWHFVLGGSFVLTLSPYGFDAGMTGRFAYTADGFPACRRSLDRLRLVLDAAGRRPTSVGLLPDRSSRVLGLAAARLLGLPAEPFAPGRPDVLAVAYDLNETDVETLHERAEGQVLFEHATCWTEPPAVSADVTGFLHQVAKSPWGEQLRVSDDGQPETVPPDERPEEELAAEIIAADPHEDEEGDGATPPDPDERLVAFARAVGGRWLTGPRDMVHSPGPVPSSRFA
ncbi:hypothetical protein E1293_25850 [Actinomadura darangshiensis]|uniref:Tetratricopeptide repeat protein n=1 Tax=Actinomadura darangshiensis TaxID=705336 RepID=A0A4R5AZR7_9ACTN|nr:hypothetical protein [Actinomadura darangshiensis]TDD77739.1 hypothetical protein E1293_25850 [Actinomadura darangshiensis]